MTEPDTELFGARFFKERRDLGRATRLTRRLRSEGTLTVLDVAGAELELARALTLLDRSRLRIECEDAARTCYVFRWASGYGNGADIRIQGVLEPATGREIPHAAPVVVKVEPPPASRSVGGESWDERGRRRRW
jgi:hypothetical protein